MRSWKSKVVVLGLALAGAACGDRPDVYDAPIETQLQAFALGDRGALLDRPANRVALLTPQAGQELERRFVAVGRSTIRAEASPDHRRLFVLSAGASRSTTTISFGFSTNAVWTVPAAGAAKSAT